MCFVQLCLYSAQYACRQDPCCLQKPKNPPLFGKIGERTKLQNMACTSKAREALAKKRMQSVVSQHSSEVVKFANSVNGSASLRAGCQLFVEIPNNSGIAKSPCTKKARRSALKVVVKNRKIKFKLLRNKVFRLHWKPR